MWNLHVLKSTGFGFYCFKGRSFRSFICIHRASLGQLYHTVSLLTFLKNLVISYRTLKTIKVNTSRMMLPVWTLFSFTTFEQTWLKELGLSSVPLSSHVTVPGLWVPERWPRLQYSREAGHLVVTWPSAQTASKLHFTIYKMWMILKWGPYKGHRASQQ